MEELKLESVFRGGDRVLAEYLDEDRLAAAKGQDWQCNLVNNYEDREAYIKEIMECSAWEQIVSIIKREFAEAKHVLRITVGQEECRSSGYPVRWIRFVYIY